MRSLESIIAWLQSTPYQEPEVIRNLEERESKIDSAALKNDILY